MTFLLVALWLLVLGGGDGCQQDGDGSRTATPQSPTEALNRRDCEEIRDTEYLSTPEREWFLNYCITAGPGPRSTTTPATPDLQKLIVTLDTGEGPVGPAEPRVITTEVKTEDDRPIEGATVHLQITGTWFEGTGDAEKEGATSAGGFYNFTWEGPLYNCAAGMTGRVYPWEVTVRVTKAGFKEEEAWAQIWATCG